MNVKDVTVVIPAKNEAKSIGEVLARIQQNLPGVGVIVVDDGSSDGTGNIAKAAGAHVIEHAYSLGNGGAIKAGARAVETPITIFMDADGQHSPDDIPRLLHGITEGADMVVGARTDDSHAMHRGIANKVFNTLASLMTEQKILDLTSGFRAVRTDRFREFLHLLPNGFSYPTTITMAFFRAGYQVVYESIVAAPREGKSHIRPLRDGIKFLTIIFKIGTLYSPLRMFMPISSVFFVLGLGYYLVTFFTSGRFTNMGALLFSTAVIIFLIGLVSEQITTLQYSQGSQRAQPPKY